MADPNKPAPFKMRFEHDSLPGLPPSPAPSAEPSFPPYRTTLPPPPGIPSNPNPFNLQQLKSVLETSDNEGGISLLNTENQPTTHLFREAVHGSIRPPSKRFSEGAGKDGGVSLLYPSKFPLEPRAVEPRENLQKTVDRLTEENRGMKKEIEDLKDSVEVLQENVVTLAKQLNAFATLVDKVLSAAEHRRE